MSGVVHPAGSRWGPRSGPRGAAGAPPRLVGVSTTSDATPSVTVTDGATVVVPRRSWVDRAMRPALLANLVMQVGIVLTGGLVRLTGSGLGCPTWPQCVPGSYTPVVEQPQGIHKYIEFGNRTLTGVIGSRRSPRSSSSSPTSGGGARPAAPARAACSCSAAVPFLGVVAQAVLGGITVLAGLIPADGRGALPALGGARSRRPRCCCSSSCTRPSASSAARCTGSPGPSPWSAAVVLVLGTVVTGSGPHSGDADTPNRFGFDPRTVSWLHADAVWLFVGLVVALMLAMRLVGATPAAHRRADLAARA